MSLPSKELFLEAFTASSHSTPYEVAKAIVDQYWNTLSEDDRTQIQMIANKSVAQYLEG